MEKEQARFLLITDTDRRSYRFHSGRRVEHLEAVIRRGIVSQSDSPSLTTASRLGAVVMLPLVSMFGTVMMPISSHFR